jgi:hypothetical protein
MTKSASSVCGFKKSPRILPYRYKIGTKEPSPDARRRSPGRLPTPQLRPRRARAGRLGAKGRQIEAEAALIYVAELIDSDADREQAIQW